jgi:hypothetical protein
VVTHNKKRPHQKIYADFDLLNFKGVYPLKDLSPNRSIEVREQGDTVHIQEYRGGEEAHDSFFVKKNGYYSYSWEIVDTDDPDIWHHLYDYVFSDVVFRYDCYHYAHAPQDSIHFTVEKITKDNIVMLSGVRYPPIAPSPQINIDSLLSSGNYNDYSKVSFVIRKREIVYDIVTKYNSLRGDIPATSKKVTQKLDVLDPKYDKNFSFFWHIYREGLYRY